MKVNIIHNPDNFARHTLLQVELERQSIKPKVSYWPAVYASKPCTGISQAHKQIVRLSKARGDKETWIMEDDIRIPSVHGLKFFLDNKPIDFDMYLGGIYSGEVKNGLVKRFCGLHCYIIHERFYDAFLACDESNHLDHEIGKLEGSYHVCYPFAAIQHNGFSENAGKVINYDNFLKKYKILGL